ncbi:NEK protein kinase [Allomyces macrogynus ATCC 38327]|uniref:non-specific serine/threonine protein kinase n=1 Tax=Allomyces macrogynus (strain ATCC 38327) TaxID=578462 RepID=A0A0L0S4T0_ALLM3|nr:NEK protein kinase [Allomyces macrogynus ATCC 38327]|eukprot:KNE57528.1 NEK protein kinase [Allomyces macrogynus ATCC 38327]
MPASATLQVSTAPAAKTGSLVQPSPTPSTDRATGPWGVSPSACFLLAQYHPLRAVGRGAHGVATLAERIQSASPTPPSPSSTASPSKPARVVVVKQAFGEIPGSDMDHDPEKFDPCQAARSEIQILAMLKHPNVIRFMASDAYLAEYDAQGRRAPQACLVMVMEYANAGNLYEYLSKQDAPLDIETISSFTAQLCLAVHYIHGRRILHRDMKSHNVLLHRASPTTSPAQMTLKLADFGISKLFMGKAIRADTVIGTPNYLSPELCRGEAYDEKSDVWALGCILYELATRNLMFEAPNLLALIKKITDRIVTVPIPPSTTPTWLAQLIDDMTALDAADRAHISAVVERPALQPAILTAVFHHGRA